MIGALTHLRDRLFGRGRHAITVPPLDGVLVPNTALDTAPTLVAAARAHHLQSRGEALWFAAGCDVFRCAAGRIETRARFAAAVRGLGVGPEGQVWSLCADGSAELPAGQRLPGGLDADRVTGIAVAADGGVWLSLGSARNGAEDWQKDLLEGGASGSLWHLPAGGGAARAVAEGLHWPARPLLCPDGSVLVAESSASRVLRIGPAGQRQTVLAHLPGYPADILRLDRGYALCLKAPRNQLIEFILREPAFCARMIAEVPPAHWIAPALYPATSFLDPLQGGALKQLGQMKPWAPSRSFGLVIELDADFVPVRSHHSRADGQSHGTLSAAWHQGRLAVAAWGAERILSLDLGQGGAGA